MSNGDISPILQQKRILPHKRILVDGFPMLKTGKLFLSRPEKKVAFSKNEDRFSGVVPQPCV